MFGQDSTDYSRIKYGGTEQLVEDVTFEEKGTLSRCNGSVHTPISQPLFRVRWERQNWSTLQSAIRFCLAILLCFGSKALAYPADCGNFSYNRLTTTRKRPAGNKLTVYNTKKSLASSKVAHIRGGGNVLSKFRQDKIPGQTQPDVTTTNRKSDRDILVWLRLLFLCYYGSLGALLPYLPVYYDSIGHGGEIIGLLGAVKPATTFLVAPLWGIIADAAQKPFTILQLTFAVSLAGQLAVSYSSDAAYIMVMVFLTALFNAPVKSLLDSMVLEQLSDRSTYGRLRLYGQLGFGLASSGAGILLSRYSKKVDWPTSHNLSPWFQRSLLDKIPRPLQSIVEFLDKCWQTVSGYRLLFVSYAVLSIPTWVCIQKFRRLHIEKDRKERQLQETKRDETSKAQPTKSNDSSNGGGTNIMDGLRLLVQNSDALFFFFLVFVVGVSSGVIENFAYVRLREVGGTGKAMGLSRLVSSIAGAPMFWFSGPLSRSLGADRVLVLSLSSYVVRFLIYAGMRNPYHGLPAEALRGVTFAAFWSTSTIYAHAVSPPGLHATMLMFLNAMYGGLGQSLGAILGGKLQNRFGTVRTFLYSAAFDACFVALVVVYLYVLPRDPHKESSFVNPKQIQVRGAKKEYK